jgi:integrase
MASIRKRPDRPKPWQLRYIDPEGKERAEHFARKGDAERRRDQLLGDRARGEWVDPDRSRLTVGKWAEEWMRGRVHLKPKTLAGYESLLRTQVLPRWRDVRLAGVQHAEVVAWVASMRANVSASRTRQAYHLLSSMLDAAVLDRRLASNPAGGVALPRLPRKERRYLDHGEVAALADACGEYRVFVLTLAYTGIRWGEAAALRVRYLDLMRGRLEIVEAVTEVNGVTVFGPPKTHQTRTVPIPAFLRDLLAVHVRERPRDALVFDAPRGGVLRVNNFRRGVWNDACTSVGLEGLVPHELRHTAASLAIASGASVKGVQAMLGHASATLTLDRYGHLFRDELEGVAKRLDAAARASLTDQGRTKRSASVRQLRPRTL